MSPTAPTCTNPKNDVGDAPNSGDSMGNVHLSPTVTNLFPRFNSKVRIIENVGGVFCWCLGDTRVNWPTPLSECVTNCHHQKVGDM